MKFTLGITTALFYMFTSMPALAGDPVFDAYDAYERGEYKKAYAGFLPIAEAGNNDVQYLVGYLYFEGQGVAQSYQNAATWFKKAADGGNVTAMLTMGEMYETDRLGPNTPEAMRWYKKAADIGNKLGQAKYDDLNAKPKIPKGFSIYKAKPAPDKPAPSVATTPTKAEQDALTYPSSNWCDTMKTAAQKQACELAQQDMLAVQQEQAMAHALKAGQEGRYPDAVPVWRKYAALGNRKAQYNMGLVYANGLTGTKNDQQAAEWYRKAADQNFDKAQYNLAQFYRLGKGVKKDLLQAAIWYEKAAKAGHVDAMLNLGVMYENGYGVEQSYISAQVWFERAKSAGAKQADEALVRISNKKSAQQDAKLDAYIARQTAPKKSRPAPQGIDQSQFGIAASDSKVIKCRELYLKRRYDKAYKKCLKPAKRGNAVAQDYLGWIQKERAHIGRKVSSTTTRYGLRDGEDDAETWFRRAAAQGYAIAQYDLGNYLGDVQWNIKAAENGYSIAQMALGEFYENTDRGDPDYKMAVYWYEKSAAQGVPFAKERLQKIYKGGYAKKSDVLEIAKRMNPNSSVNAFLAAIPINRNWVEPGDEQSEILYAKGKKIFDEAGLNYTIMQSTVPIFKQAAKLGNAKATYMLGAMQSTSDRNADRDQGRLEQARLYTLSAEMGYVKAQDILADLYNLGDKIKKSYPQAAYWYKKAAAQGHAAAREKLRYLLQSGKVTIDEIPQTSSTAQRKFSPKENFFAGLEAGYNKDYKKAETYMLRSAGKGYVPAQAALGKMYYNGEGVVRSIDNAYKWYGKAADNGDVQSQYMMGYLWDSNATKDIAYKMLLAGLNVDRVLKARAWYNQAANNGHAEAKVKLAALSSYKPVPPPPIKRGWFEQFAYDLANGTLNTGTSSYTPIPGQSRREVCSAWRCYNVGGGKEQCFRDC